MEACALCPRPLLPPLRWSKGWQMAVVGHTY
jgi:hypothetical protein